MKRKRIMETPAKKPEKKGGKQITAQILELAENRYLLLDIWENGKLYARHAMDTATGEYGTYKTPGQTWTEERLDNAVRNVRWGYGTVREKEYPISEEDKKIILSVTEDTEECWRQDSYGRIIEMEEKYGEELRRKKTERRRKRISELMDLCPSPGAGVRDWIADTAAGDLHYAFWEKATAAYHCTACGGSFPAAGVRWKHREKGSCPLCGHAVTAIKRGDRITLKTALTIIHDLDKKRGVERHFRVEISWSRKGREVSLDEQIRLVLLREGKKRWKIYHRGNWNEWSEGNRANRRWNTGYLYPAGEDIRTGLKGTAYEAWSSVMPQLAQAGIEADYNKLLVESNRHFVQMTEYLFKGRFYRLLKETSEEISYYYGYKSILRMHADMIEGVMQIKDRQKINRLRQENGGTVMLQWLQWSDAGGKKISSEALKWFEKNVIGSGTYQKSRAAKYMTPEQLMHYIDRQQRESYPKRKKAAVFEQYEDYLDMAQQLGKRMDDAMICRPRELKRRHDELAEELNKRREEQQRKRDKEAAARQAEAMRQKYPGYEELLQEIKQKYEYDNDTYLIRVPKDFMEITAEGMALHHCVGNTERYFDRIVSRETYICFLRQQSSPETPYYTIEVEPGGTIRQHRGEYDEEPDIEQIKPFLREWQKVIRKRMGREDHEYAEKSAVLRQKNIEELKEKNNTRVLNGLMEDLMEVI